MVLRREPIHNALFLTFLTRGRPRSHRAVMSDRPLHIRLNPGELAPTDPCWMVQSGYVRLSCNNDADNSTTLGIWGPGEQVMPALLSIDGLQLIALSPVELRACEPTPEQERHCMHLQLQQLATLLQLARIRRAEQRLFHLLLWLGERFGQSSGEGVRLSFNSLHLTHRNLAAITGMTRVTITKALIRFRQEGRLSRQGREELLRPAALQAINAGVGSP